MLDGNIERVLARLFAVTTPLPAAKPLLRRIAAAVAPSERSGDYAQGMMDLGAGLCSPRRPACQLCPFSAACVARREHDPEAFPAKTAKPERPTRRGVAFWLMRGDGAVLLRKRPPTGLLGGMIEVPTGAWTTDPLDEAALDREAPTRAAWSRIEGVVTHTFTHFHLELTVLTARTRLGDPRLGIWCPLDRLGEQALPSLFKKVARHALARTVS